MKYLGFISKTIEWLGSYLKKQNFVVSLEKTVSETEFGIVVSLKDQYEDQTSRIKLSIDHSGIKLSIHFGQDKTKII